MKVGFVCVQNAGRSQMATAFAERERRRRDDGEEIAIVTGGTRPAEHVHEEVLEAMGDLGFDLSDRTPREITHEELRTTDVVITMGCSAQDVCPATWSGDSRDWDLDDPDGRSPDEVAAIRDEIEDRVEALFDELLVEQ
jgi:arsenate reductase